MACLAKLETVNCDPPRKRRGDKNPVREAEPQREETVQEDLGKAGRRELQQGQHQ